MILLHTQEGEHYRFLAYMIFNTDKDFIVTQVLETGLCFTTITQVKDKASSKSYMISSIKSPLTVHLAAKRGARPSAHVQITIDFEDKGMINYFCF